MTINGCVVVVEKGKGDSSFHMRGRFSLPSQPSPAAVDGWYSRTSPIRYLEGKFQRKVKKVHWELSNLHLVAQLCGEISFDINLGIILEKELNSN